MKNNDQKEVFGTFATIIAVTSATILAGLQLKELESLGSLNFWTGNSTLNQPIAMTASSLVAFLAMFTALLSIVYCILRLKPEDNCILKILKNKKVMNIILATNLLMLSYLLFTLFLGGRADIALVATIGEGVVLAWAIFTVKN